MPARIVREIYEHFVLYAALLYFAVLGVTCTLVSAVVYPLLPRETGRRVGRQTIGFVFRTYLALLQFSGVMKLDLSVLDALQAERSVVVAPNHPSLIDAVLVISRLPDIACIMKAEIWDSPILGGGARLARYIRNDSPSNMVRFAINELKHGQNLLVFPEGTRTRANPVNAFKGGFALIAKRAGAPIQTVFIETNSAFLSKGWPILKKPRMPLVYRLRLGRRFHVTGSVKAFVAGLERYYHHEMKGADSLDRHAAPDTARATGPTPAP
ncbi:MAG TPA: lysophospholipid acyltransferase family protein [Burkholderiales bacterium]|nr:lysophospholipid acyltransferase family protein [Burkholderiales bacterium]